MAEKPFRYAHHTTTAEDILRARALRREMTKPERILWRRLRELPSELNLTFRRQHPVHPYILDFACIRIKLAVELDGESHDHTQAYDAQRDRYLSGKGYTTLRFTNDDVMTNIEGVVASIIEVALKMERAEALPPWGEGWVGGQEREIIL